MYYVYIFILFTTRFRVIQAIKYNIFSCTLINIRKKNIYYSHHNIFVSGFKNTIPCFNEPLVVI